MPRGNTWTDRYHALLVEEGLGDGSVTTLSGINGYRPGRGEDFWKGVAVRFREALEKEQEEAEDLSLAILHGRVFRRGRDCVLDRASVPRDPNALKDPANWGRVLAWAAGVLSGTKSDVRDISRKMPRTFEEAVATFRGLCSSRIGWTVQEPDVLADEAQADCLFASIGEQPVEGKWKIAYVQSYHKQGHVERRQVWVFENLTFALETDTGFVKQRDLVLEDISPLSLNPPTARSLRALLELVENLSLCRGVQHAEAVDRIKSDPTFALVQKVKADKFIVRFNTTALGSIVCAVDCHGVCRGRAQMCPGCARVSDVIRKRLSRAKKRAAELLVEQLLGTESVDQHDGRKQREQKGRTSFAGGTGSQTRQELRRNLAESQKTIHDMNRRLEKLRKRSKRHITKHGFEVHKDNVNEDFLNLFRGANNSFSNSDYAKKEFLNHLWTEQLRRIDRADHGAGLMWDPLVLRIALLLHSTSPAAYKTLGQAGMRLPSDRTLREYRNSVQQAPGIVRGHLDQIAKAIENEEKGNKHLTRIGGIALDEVMIEEIQDSREARLPGKG